MESVLRSLMSNLDAISDKLQDQEYRLMADGLGELWRLRERPVAVESAATTRSRIREVMDGHTPIRGTGMDLFGVRRPVAPPRSVPVAPPEAADFSDDDLGGPDEVGDRVWTLTNPEFMDLDAMEDLVSFL